MNGSMRSLACGIAQRFGRVGLFALTAAALAALWLLTTPPRIGEAQAGSGCYQQCSAEYGRCLDATNGNQAVCSAQRKACLARCTP